MSVEKRQFLQGEETQTTCRLEILSLITILFSPLLIIFGKNSHILKHEPCQGHYKRERPLFIINNILLYANLYAHIHIISRICSIKSLQH